MKRIVTTLLLAVGLSAAGSAQISAGGTPASITYSLGQVSINTVTTPALNMHQINAEDAVQAKNGNWPRIAVSHQANYNLQNSGSWQTLPNGDRLWRLRIVAPNAKGIILGYENFALPNGAKLFLYNDDRTETLGAFTKDNNPQNGIFSTALVHGDAVTLEYIEPASVSGMGHFTIKEIGHAYRMVPRDMAGNRNFGNSDPCQVNVNCSPEGDNWQDEKRGVGRILLKDGPNWGWCSGSLVNNTAEDCHPYFLTAFHCGETSSAADKAQWIFYFNYESAGCSNPGSEPGSNTATGCTLVAHSNDGGGSSGSDFQLVELNGGNPLPTAWNLYYNGWNSSNTASTSGVGIHHPSGDIKKISTYNSNLISTTWGGPSGSHWRVQWISTANGHGVTEGGSSGSPIFDQNSRIIGTLTGGSSFCTSPNNPDIYGKMWYHWGQNTNPTGGHLAQFLDPLNSGTTTLDGTYAPCSPSAPTCNISASTTTITAGGTVDFFDNSGGIPTSWSWDFGGGGTPATSTDQNPSGIVFSTPGTYTVTMTATNAQGSCNTTITINVIPSTGCDTLNYLPVGTPAIYVADAANPLDSGFIAGYNAYEDISKAQRFNTYNPYTHVTGGLFYFFAAYDQGAASTVNFNVWDEVAGEPGTVIGQVSVPLANLNAAVPTGGGFVQIIFDQPVNVGGNPFYLGVEMINFDNGDSLSILHTTAGDAPVSDQSWEQWSDGSWFSLNAAWGTDMDLFISPFMTDQPVSAVMTPATGFTNCEGATVAFDGSGSSNATAYDWTFTGGTPNTATGVSTSTIYNTAGTYTAYLEASGACNGYSVDSVENIVINAAPTLTTSTTPENCGAADGTITITAAGGAPGYQYSIDGGVSFSGTATFNGLTAGLYQVVVEDANGCQGVGSVTVGSSNGGITVNATATDENCGGSNGEITVTATGGTGTYTYSIGGAFQTPNTFTGLTANTYLVTAEDGNGCQGTTTVVVGSSSPTISVTGSSTDATCTGSDGSLTAVATGGTAPYDYSIDGGTTYQGATFNNLAAGVYTVDVLDANGCVGTGSVTVGTTTVTLNVNVTGTDENCGGADGTVTASVSNGTSPYDYTLNATTNTTGNFTGLTASGYTVSVVDANGCTGTGNTTINNVGGPTINGVTETDPLCDGTTDGEITINATGATQYSIDGGVTWQPGATFSGLGSGTYNISVDNGACISTTTATLSDPTVVTVNAVTVNESCAGNDGEVTATAAGGTGTYTYSFDNGVTFGASATSTGLTAGTYDVVAQDANGCTSTAFTATVGGSTAVVLNVTTGDENCAGADGTIDITATGGDGGPYMYSIDGGTTMQTSSSFTGLPAGTYNVYVEDASGNCTATSTETINNTGTAINGTISPTQTICDGESVTLTATGGGTYLWTPGGQTTASITVTPSATTTYMVTITQGSCTEDLTTIVAVNPSPTAVAGANVDTTYLGSGATVNFDNTGSSTGGSVSYLWDYGDGNFGTAGSPTFSYSAAGTYDVVLTVTENGCSATDTITIVVINNVGIDDTSLAESISVYPNPTNGMVQLSINLAQSRDLRIEVYDAIGALIESTPLFNVGNYNHQLDLTDVANGIYFVKVIDGVDAHTIRVSVQK